MNYQRIHDSIIERAKLGNREQQDRSHSKYIYYEQHHILPKCLKGDNSKENLVFLTAKEHFIVHKLLVEIYPNEYKLINAFWMMSNKVSSNNNRTYKVGMREYERLKDLFSKRMSGKDSPRYGKKPWNKGRIATQEERDRISKRNKGRKRSVESVLKQIETNKIKYPNGENYKSSLGRKQSKETIEKRRKSTKGKKRTKEFCNRLSNSRKGEGNPMYGRKAWNNGIKRKEETKEKQRESWSQRPLKTCLYCAMQGRGGGMTRYHFDNCKQNPRNQTMIESLIKEKVDG